MLLTVDVGNTNITLGLFEGKDILNGKHANTTIPKFLGAIYRYTALGCRTEDEFYLEAVKKFWDITLPLIMPAVISGSLLAFAMSMDDVVISIFVNGPRLSTLPIKVYTQLKTGVTPEINALCTILLVATLVIFIVYSLITKKKK